MCATNASEVRPTASEAARLVVSVTAKLLALEVARLEVPDDVDWCNGGAHSVTARFAASSFALTCAMAFAARRLRLKSAETDRRDVDALPLAVLTLPAVELSLPISLPTLQHW